MPFFIEKAQAATSYDFGFLKEGFRALVDRSGTAGIQILATNVINALLLIAGAMAVIYLIYSGILYITAAGNPDAVKKGQQGIINAVIGIAVIVLAFFIARSVSNYIQTSVGTGGSTPTAAPATSTGTGAPGSSETTPSTSEAGTPSGGGTTTDESVRPGGTRGITPMD